MVESPIKSVEAELWRSSTAALTSTWDGQRPRSPSFWAHCDRLALLGIFAHRYVCPAPELSQNVEYHLASTFPLALEFSASAGKKHEQPPTQMMRRRSTTSHRHPIRRTSIASWLYERGKHVELATLKEADPTICRKNEHSYE